MTAVYSLQARKATARFDLARGTDSPERIGLIAGNGTLPLLVAETLQLHGKNPFVVGIEGEADPKLRAFDFTSVYTGHVGRVVSALKAAKVTDVVMVGGVRSRPKYHRIIPDWTTLKFAARLLPRLGAGDDALLRGVISTIEDVGIRVRGVHEVVPDLLAPAGHLAGPKPDQATIQSLDTAMRGALALGKLDAGQAAVAIRKRLIALEGAEGTDLMLERVVNLRQIERLPDNRGGALVKIAKPGQDLRADLPTIGPETIIKASNAKLKAVAVHAGHALVAEIEHTKTLAREHKISLIGLDPQRLLSGAD
ncbi:MAG: UDP-2,3-diacylglucosamine diphosphatase LpxI [Pseudomonadota bacterium]